MVVLGVAVAGEETGSCLTKGEVAVNNAIIIIKLNNLWWWRKLFGVIQISVVRRLVSKVEPIRVIRFVER